MLVSQYENDRGVRGNKDSLDTVLCTGESSGGVLDKLSKGELEVKTVEELFSKMKNEFRETVEEEKKIEQLRTIEQGERTCNKYVQEFKKVVRRSNYKG